MGRRVINIGCVSETETDKQTSQRKGGDRNRHGDRQRGGLTETEQVSHSRSLPPFPLKTHLLLTDEKHNASVTWTLICSSYLSSSFPDPIKTDNQTGTETWRPRSSQKPKLGKFSFSDSLCTPVSGVRVDQGEGSSYKLNFGATG